MRRTFAALAAVAVAVVALPLAGLLARTPWSSLWSELTAPEALTALRLSLLTSTLAVAVALTVGVPLAWAQARCSYPGRSVVRALTTLPLVLPPVVGGVALLLAFGRRGFAGRLLGVGLPFTTAGAVLAQVFVALPFVVLTVEAGLRASDTRYEEAARAMGASPWRVWWRVTVPLVRPSLAAGAVLAWARALGEFGATVTFAGNLPGETRTLPLAVYSALESRPESAVALSLLLLLVSLAVLGLLRDRWLNR